MAADATLLASYLKEQDVESQVSAGIASLLWERPLNAGRRLADTLITLSMSPEGTTRELSLPKSVQAAGGIDAWNEKNPELKSLKKMLLGMCMAQSAEEALEEVLALIALGQDFMGYAYMRTLYNASPDVFYATLLAAPQELRSVVYTPTVGAACQNVSRPHSRAATRTRRHAQ
eukprot:5479311-Prymnesium_polylepis.2